MLSFDINFFFYIFLKHLNSHDREIYADRIRRCSEASLVLDSRYVV